MHMTSTDFTSQRKISEARVSAVVVAAGRGMRASTGHTTAVAKQYRQLAGRSVLARTLKAMLASPLIDSIIVVIGAGDAQDYACVLAELSLAEQSRLLPSVVGGATRQSSVRAGLAALAATAPDVVLVHDAARPFVTSELVTRLIGAALQHGAAIPGITITDTIKQIDPTQSVRATLERAALRAVQTPQAFAFSLLLAAHTQVANTDDAQATDDAALIEAMGKPVIVVMGDPMNIKLTTQADFDAAERQLSQGLITRIGQGYDVHAFGPGDHVWLGGIRIPHDKGVIAHSDGDVVLHALTDAVLGALADGDIGSHFPPSDPQWRGASSDHFLMHACALVRAKGGIIDHLDATLVSESPRVGPHRSAIVACIAKITGLPATSVSIKATTSERLGFTGRSEGLAAMAVATIRLPAS
jgi:2-C-methyl-D-erythritol 4-phosphate cytidylyltransferase / 2-C-methyl-D-erythritol 2,4-cyclodiphosphate synthase